MSLKLLLRRDNSPVRLTPYSTYSASFFSQNSVFLSQQFSRNSVFSQFQPSFKPANGAFALRGYCVLAPILNPNCGFSPHFLSLCVFTPVFSKRRFSLPLLREQQVTVLKKLKDDKFALPNIALFQTSIVILPPLSSTLCFYPYFSKTKAPFTPILNSVIYIRIKAIKN